ncbi:MAG: hypothetical protein AB7F89_26585 [Pirellulaceae bacterium]
MPLTLHVGYSQKLGLPDYGSLGASCQVEIELDGSLLVHDLEGFHHRVQEAFTACRQAVQDELARHETPGALPLRTPAEPLPEAAPPRSPSPTNGSHGPGYRATDKQFDYVRRLASQIPGLGVRRVEQLATKMLGKPLAELTSLDASALIDQLKAIKAGDVDIEHVLGNGAAS